MPDGTNPVKLGDKVTDRVTGFTGTAMARAEYLYDTPRVLVQPRGHFYGKADEPQWIEEARLIILKPPAPKPAATRAPIPPPTPQWPKETTC